MFSYGGTQNHPQVELSQAQLSPFHALCSQAPFHEIVFDTLASVVVCNLATIMVTSYY
jgi:hypothetical protein